MADKQIIINGVDVSGCNYYADGKCTNSHMIQSNCKNVAVCYYKEYKRKEQVLQEVKDVLNFYANSRIGEEQEDGTYKVVEKNVHVLGGTCVIYYDPRPAKEALRRINEVEDDR